jgi:pilus assembly protein CpaF
VTAIAAIAAASLVRSVLDELTRRGQLTVVGDATAPPDRDHVAAAARSVLERSQPLLAPDAARVLLHDIVADIAGFGVLEVLLDDPEVTEIMVNGPGPVWVERRGVLACTTIVLSSLELQRSIDRMLLPLGLRLDRLSPMVDARLADGSRVHAVLAPLAVDGPYLTVRRFRALPLRLDELADLSTAQQLRDAVVDRSSILVFGPTGSGKTTLLNALGASVSAGERVITIEDTAELRLPGDHVVRLECRPATAEGVGAIDLRSLVRTALRMRPDRIIVGEVRGPEAFDLVQALLTGHRGGLATIHARTAIDALRRLETLVLLAGTGLSDVAIRRQIAAAFDLVVGVARGDDGRRGVVFFGPLALVDGEFTVTERNEARQ